MLALLLPLLVQAAAAPPIAVDPADVQIVYVQHLLPGGPWEERTADGGRMLSTGGPALRSRWGPYCHLNAGDAVAMINALQRAAPRSRGFGGNLAITIRLHDNRELHVRAPARGQEALFGVEVDGAYYALDRASLAQVQGLADGADCRQLSVPDIATLNRLEGR